MNASTFSLIQLGLYALIELWARHENKPPGWVPTPEDWAKLRASVIADTPEAMLNEAKKRLAGATTATNQ